MHFLLYLNNPFVYLTYKSKCQTNLIYESMK